MNFFIVWWKSSHWLFYRCTNYNFLLFSAELGHYNSSHNNNNNKVTCLICWTSMSAALRPDGSIPGVLRPIHPNHRFPPCHQGPRFVIGSKEISATKYLRFWFWFLLFVSSHFSLVDLKGISPQYQSIPWSLLPGFQSFSVQVTFIWPSLDVWSAGCRGIPRKACVSIITWFFYLCSLFFPYSVRFFFFRKGI